MTGQALKALVESMFEVIRDRSSADELAIICPVPGCGDTTGNRGINLKNGKTNCWRCNTGGDFTRWAKWLGYAFDDAETVSVSVEELCLMLEPPKPRLIVPVINEISLPKGFHSCYDNPDSVFTKEIGKMAVRKNLSPDDLVAEGVGYVTGDQRWEPFAVFPVLEHDRLVYFQGRTYWDEPGISTKKFPNRQEAPLSSKYWMYDIDRLKEPVVDTAIIVESILNVVSLKKQFAELGVTNMAPICVFKHAISKPQFFKLLRFKNLKEVVLLFDFDAIDLSWEDARKIDDHIRVSIAEMPFSAVNKKLDPNDDVVSACAAIEHRKPFRLEGRAERRIEAAAEHFCTPNLNNTVIDLSTQMSTPEVCSSVHAES